VFSSDVASAASPFNSVSANVHRDDERPSKLMTMAASGPTEPTTSFPDPAVLPPDQLQRREKIIDAAAVLLDRTEYQDIQIRDVCRQAGVALGTLYRYFSSKEHLYAAVFVKWGSAFRAVPASAASGNRRDADALKASLRRAIRAFEKKRHYVRTEMVLRASADPEALRLFNQFGEHNLAVFSSPIDGLSPAASSEVAAIAGMVLRDALHRWISGRCTIKQVEDETARTVDLLVRGARAAARPPVEEHH
jgi:AcrR family transcriptional regulator